VSQERHARWHGPKLGGARTTQYTFEAEGFELVAVGKDVSECFAVGGELPAEVNVGEVPDRPHVRSERPGSILEG